MRTSLSIGNTIPNCPVLGEMYISYTTLIPTNIMFGHTYYHYNEEKNTLDAFKFLAFAITGDRNNAYTSCACQFGDRVVWIPNFVKKQYKNIFANKEDFFSNIGNGNRHANLQTEAIYCRIPEYHYNAAWGAKGLGFIWKNGTPIASANNIMKHVVVNRDGLHIILNNEDSNGNKVYLSKEECIKDSLAGLVINDMVDAESNEIHIEASNVKTERHTIRILEY